MNKFIKKAFSVLVTAILIMPIGCSNENINQGSSEEIQQETNDVLGQTGTMGAYLTKEIDLPGEARGYIVQDEAGSIYYYDIGDVCTIYAFNEEGIWQQQGQITLPSDIRKIYKLFNIEGSMQIIFGNKKGELYIAKEEADSNFEVISITKEGQPVKENINAAWTIALDKAQNIYMSMGMGQGKIQKYDGENGKWIKEYSDEVSDFIITNEQIYGVSKQEKNIKVYDCETGKVNKIIMYNGNGEMKLFNGLNEGDLYACNDQGISYLSNDGGLWEQVVMPDQLKNTEIKVKDYTIYPYGTSFLIYYEREGSNLLESCYYESDCATIPSRIVNIYMTYENEQIRKAVQIYQQEHRDVRVNVNSAIRGTRHIHEYIVESENLPTSDADLLVLEGYIDDYVLDGNLADLTDVAEELTKEDILNEQIAGSLKKDDKYYVIPLNYGIGMIWGNKEIINQVNTLEDLAKYKQQHPEQILLGETRLELFRQLIDSCFPSWFDEEGEFDEASYRSFLESITTLEEEKYDNLNEKGYCYNIGLNSDSKKAELSNLAKGKTQLVAVGAYSLKELADIENMLEERTDLGRKELIGQGKEGIYYAGSIMAVNARSENQDIAKEIIKIALSDEVQNVGREYRISTNHKVFETQLNNAIQSEEDEKLYTQFEEWNNNLQICVNKYDYKAYAIIYRETKEYCMGHQTMRDTIESIKREIKSTKEDNLESYWYHIE